MAYMLRFLKPHDASIEDDYVVRCSCGRAMWLLGSNEDVRKHHAGHKMSPCREGSMWEFFKMKTGLLKRRTFNEWFRDQIEGS